MPLLTNWLPLLLTGSVNAYYFPKYRDQLFSHNALIIPNAMALVSSYFFPNEENTITQVFSDTIVVQNRAAEFKDYLSQCRLLSSIFQESQNDSYIKQIFWFDTEPTTSMCKAPVFTNMTMPKSLLKTMFNSTGGEREALSFQLKRLALFEKTLAVSSHTEIIPLPAAAAVVAGQVQLSYPDLLQSQNRCYTPSEFISHVRHVIYLLEKYPNYQLYLAPDSVCDDITIHTKEKIGVIFSKSSQSAVFFLVTEPLITRAFGDYLQDIIHYIPHQNKNKETVVNTLKKTIAEVESLLS